jgi:hypothetical protein
MELDKIWKTLVDLRKLKKKINSSTQIKKRMIMSKRRIVLKKKEAFIPVAVRNRNLINLISKIQMAASGEQSECLRI